MSHLRPLLPAVLSADTNAGSSAFTPTGTPATKASRKNRADMACMACRKRRSKCNAARPTCLRCALAGLTCEYEAPAAEVMKRKIDELEATIETLAQSEVRLKRRNEVLEELVEILHRRPEHEVGSVVSRVRAGDDVESIVRLVKDGDLLLQLALDPTAVPFCFQFPLLSTMPSFLDVRGNAYIRSILYHHTLGRHQPKQPSAAVAEADSRDDAPAPQDNAAREASPAPDGFGKMYDAPFHAARLAEPRLDKIKASRWTSVTSSDKLVRTLLEIYFIHEFTFCCIFHKDHFLDDMVAGRERYCSRLLVNAILAIACHGHRGIDRRSHHWNPQSLYYQFTAEFKRLWELEAGERRITTVQAGAIACVAHNVDGLDKLGTLFLAQAIAMGVEMGIFKQETYSSLSAKRRVVYAATAQGIYAWESLQSYCFFRGPMVITPPPPFPPRDNVHHSQYAGELWLQYSGMERLVPCHHGLSFRAVVEFRLIMCDVAERVYGEGKFQGPLSLLEAMSYRQRLLQWYDDLPPPLKADKIATPSDLKMHMHYHNLMMMLFEPCVSIAVGGLDADVLVGDATPDSIVAYSKACYETLFRLYYLRHGSEPWDSVMIHYSSIAAFVAVSRLHALVQPPSPTNSGDRAVMTSAQRRLRDEALSGVMLSAKSLRDHARYSLLSEVILRVLRDAMSPDELKLLKDLDVDLEPTAEEGSHTTYLRSLYPVNMVSVSDDPQSKRMDAVIRSYTRLGLQPEDGQSPQSSTAAESTPRAGGAS